jgi:amino-acid N-acetyltransferase
MEWQVYRATPEDAPGVLDLLDEARLPREGLEAHLGTTLVARQNGRVVGSAALEIYPDGVLLRSVAVAPVLHGTGAGRELTSAAIRLAEDFHAPAIYLLTTTAEGFFPRFGFQRISRDEVPAGVRTSIEFVSACPASATAMRKVL